MHSVFKLDPMRLDRPIIPERHTAAADAPAGDESNAEDKFNNIHDEKFSSTLTLLLHLRYDCH